MNLTSPANWKITYKILSITLLVSLAVWFFLDYYQKQKLQDIFLAQVYADLEQGAADDRALFDQHVQAILRSVKLIGGQKKFIDFIENMPAIESPQPIDMAHHGQLPSWMPSSSVLRTFYGARYALLFDEKGFLRSAYHYSSEHDGDEELPEGLLDPHSVLRKLSHNQAYMTMVDGKPLMISSEQSSTARGKVTLALISPLDSKFLAEAVSVQHHSSIVTLINESGDKVIASSNNEKISVGADVSELTEHYIMISKSFFDYGASDIGLQLSSFASTEEAKITASNVLRENNIQRATLVAVMILTFMLITLFFVRRIVMLARGVNKLSLEVLKRNIEGKTTGDEIAILDDQIFLFASEISSSRQQLQQEVVVANKLAESLTKLHFEKSESEKRMQEIMDYSPAAIYVEDLEGHFTFINQKVATLYGQQPSEIIGKSLKDLLPEDLAAGIYANDMKVMETGESWKFEEAFPQHGELRYYLSIKFPLFNEDKEMYAIGSVSTDITERKLNEQKIRSQRDFTNTILDSAANVIVVMDLDGMFVHFNRAAEKLTGYQSDDILGKRFWNYVIPEEQQDGVEAVFVNLKKGNINNAAEYENEWLTREGTRRMLHWHNSILRDEHGKVSHIMALGYDITEKKQAEIENARIQKELQQAQKMESLGHLTGGIAHDFNNLLGIIKGYTDLALGSCGKAKDEKIERYLGNIRTASNRAADLVAQMLLFSRGEQTVETPLRLSTHIKEDIKMMRSTLPTSMEIVSEIDDELPNVLMNPTQLHQILLNLSINARDAMQGVGTLTIRLRWVEGLNTESSILHKPVTGDWIELSVSDTGSGIDPDIVKDIFNPFFTTKEVGKGTGMGLSVIYRIMENYQGHILLESELGKGSTFRLLFAPVLEESSNTITESDKEIVRISAGDASEILVVDDEPMMLDQLSEFIEIYGYKPISFTDSSKALEAFKDEPDRYSALITDQTMPKMTGVELIQEIRKLRPQFPAIMCSGYSDKIDAVSAVELGITYFSKPVDVDELLTRLGELIGMNK